MGAWAPEGHAISSSAERIRHFKAKTPVTLRGRLLSQNLHVNQKAGETDCREVVSIARLDLRTRNHIIFNSMDSTNSSSEDVRTDKPIFAFLVWAFVLTWVLLFLALWYSSVEVTVRFVGHALRITLPTLLSFLANLGPAAAALIVLSTKNRRDERKSLLKETFAWRVSWRGYFLALGIPTLILGVAVVELLTITGLPFHWYQGAFGMWFGTLFFGALFRSLGEEIGWRGFLLPRLQVRMSGFAASLLVGLTWWTWHLPIRLNPEQAFLLTGNIIYLVEVLSFSVLLTWLRNAIPGSLVPVTLFHAAFNAGLDTTQISGNAWIQFRWLICLTVSMLLAACLVLTIFGKQLGAAPEIRARG